MIDDVGVLTNVTVVKLCTIQVCSRSQRTYDAGNKQRSVAVLGYRNCSYHYLLSQKILHCEWECAKLPTITMDSARFLVQAYPPFAGARRDSALLLCAETSFLQRFVQ